MLAIAAASMLVAFAPKITISRYDIVFKACFAVRECCYIAILL
ncbi:hypothetical protein BIFADO_02486 [Bifidobacterium adolescentis L2-32]|uniref:Uncharacterized protein n=1 Tax=Bifidobacterium adolescentis L2-32 TaxID=411481 RepID=A7A9D8_BIFAD|nr:hypothetical protein BIFADO_02486 [Bifidobacterium adolescentis L2-32]